MRRLSVFSALSLAVTGVAIACSSSSGQNGFGNPDGGGNASSGTGASSSGTTSSSGSSSGTTGLGDTDGGGQQGIDGGEIVTYTVYAHTDNELYSVDPKTSIVTDMGPLVGVGDAGPGYDDQDITDLAVDSKGNVYVNTEDYLYTVALPASTATLPTPVTVTKVAPITAAGGTLGSSKFVALAFAPPGLLGGGTVETLVGGDENGDVWAINPTSGAAQNLGSFGADPNISGNFFALSGDIVFYTQNGTPTGIATIRSCTLVGSGSSAYTTCVKDNDYLAGINIAALTANYTNNNQAESLNGGMYGGTSLDGGVGTTGPGIGFGEVFGLGAWSGTVYGFTNYQAGKDGGASTPPSFITIDTTTGVGTAVSGNDFTFTNGWAGAGVTTTVTVTILPPPPPPPPQ